MIVGKERLALLNKRVGERIKLYGLNYRGIDLELEIVGVFPPGRYDKSAVINRDYLLNEVLEAWPRKHNGQKHPLAEKCLNLVWLRVPDTNAFATIADQIESSPYYSNPAVKCETASSGIASFLDAYRDLIWGMRWLLVPAALVSLALVIANAISISVRQRRLELAVMKVLGFRPLQILVLVLGEALLLGVTAGFVSSRADVVSGQQRLRRHSVSDRVLPGVLHRGRRPLVGPGHRRPRRARRQHLARLVGLLGESVGSVCEGDVMSETEISHRATEAQSSRKAAQQPCILCAPVPPCEQICLGCGSIAV